VVAVFAPPSVDVIVPVYAPASVLGIDTVNVTVAEFPAVTVVLPIVGALIVFPLVSVKTVLVLDTTKSVAPEFVNTRLKLAELPGSPDWLATLALRFPAYAMLKTNANINIKLTISLFILIPPRNLIKIPLILIFKGYGLYFLFLS
jgi:hypothetical protein